MDNLTHTVSRDWRAPRFAAAAGTAAARILASNAPDIDIVATAGGALKYLEWHRGPSHGPLGIVGLGLLTAGLVWSGRRLFDPGRAANHLPFRQLAIVSIAGVLLHVLMDLPTAYGTRLFSPFDFHGFIDLIHFDVTRIAFVAGLVFAARFDPTQRRICDRLALMA